MNYTLSTTLLALLSIGLVAACSQSESKQSESKSGTAEKASFTMYKNPGCMCCDKWAEHMEANGYEVTIKPVDNLYALKFNYKVPNDMGSCHTAIIDGYVVEGHVPVADVNKLLNERPDAVGIAVPGMPTGSPGMEVPGKEPESYKVMLFREDGSRTVYASH